MDSPALPPLPHPPPPPRPSSLFTYLLIGAVGLGVVAFGYLLFGPFMLIALAVALIIGLVGALHYFTWGRSMTEQAKKEAKARESEELIER